MTDYTWVGLFMPAGTPPAIVQKLYDAVHKIVQTPDMKARFDALAFDALAEPPARTAEYTGSSGRKSRLTCSYLAAQENAIS